jgi:hypothetical protein
LIHWARVPPVSNTFELRISGILCSYAISALRLGEITVSTRYWLPK